MSRPETFDDLPDYARKGHLVCTIPNEFLAAFPKVGGHLLAALIAADEAGMVRDGDDVVVPLTDDERARKIAEAQAMWDRAEEYYHRAAGGEPLENYLRYTAKRHATDEHLPVPEFDEDGYATFPAEVTL